MPTFEHKKLIPRDGDRVLWHGEKRLLRIDQQTGCMHLVNGRMHKHETVPRGPVTYSMNRATWDKCMHYDLGLYKWVIKKEVMSGNGRVNTIITSGNVSEK